MDIKNDLYNLAERWEKEAVTHGSHDNEVAKEFAHSRIVCASELKECIRRLEGINTSYSGLNIADVSNNEAKICEHCGKYKRLQGNGMIHQLCECGSEVEV